MGGDHPVAWYHDFDGGRAWYTALDCGQPVVLASAVVADGRPVRRVGAGASGFARERRVETCVPCVFRIERQLVRWRLAGADTGGGVARADRGRPAVAVSAGG